MYLCRSKAKLASSRWSANRAHAYWDYTKLRFPRREGMRIDFALCSPALAARVTGASIDREERKGKGASDHAPVVVDIADRPQGPKVGLLAPWGMPGGQP